MTLGLVDFITVVTITLMLVLLTEQAAQARHLEQPPSHFCQVYLSGFKSRWGSALEKKLQNVKDDEEISGVGLDVYLRLPPAGLERAGREEFISQLKELGVRSFIELIQPNTDLLSASETQF
jgi:hypothetical protein